ncbi:TetR/AcrR family transcriptional regulator [Aeromicrobium duanguangcaii]|uniref:TetR/AcrR family transcriptional regulator n=1 Tax=Aeromicrobium duanguangcaii TaxID=2968086 RepID=A0ABY5KEJ4_9ACTN|nr:TetR/AcrR family transcriptional regulator [Aeromicrobium duanguangcaii]MCD9155138.1 TetR/AcrR family transcriptional regulator [Aeromicrobium duanguangcaii]MCL3838484.1 TetR/AcrR family transcriptional regulator [Aeromicrobium duanguangcaii]UUI68208.1 TetR/AcrR family transcriptional regulator [Aeromicrobium duanguangcaii]
MPETKVSRAERQRQTRERLIEVAAQMFLAVGYAGTSLDKVAVEAGFSKGAVYSNFAGKEELCMAVLDTIHAEKIRLVQAVFAEDTSLESRLKSFVEWSRTGLGEPQWTALEVEFAAVARNNPWVASELVKRHREIRRLIGQLISATIEEADLETTIPVEHVATALLALGAGLGGLRALDPKIDPDVFGVVLAGLVRPRREVRGDA